MRRPAVLLAVLGVVAVLLKKRSKAQRAERDMWTEASWGATAAPDLR